MFIVPHALQLSLPIVSAQSTLGPLSGKNFDTTAFLYDKSAQSSLSLVTHATNSSLIHDPIPGVIDDLFEGSGFYNISTDPYSDHINTQTSLLFLALIPQIIIMPSILRLQQTLPRLYITHQFWSDMKCQLLLPAQHLLLANS